MISNTIQLHSCRTCGLYDPNFFPWGDDGETPTDDICSCCGTHAGLGLDEVDQIRERRRVWFARGCTWSYPEDKPENWDLANQLKNIRPDYL